MATVILVRHGRTTANASGLLAGRTPGVLLDETGRAQAAATGARLASVPLARLVTSPLERCVETAAAIRAQQPTDPFDAPHVDPSLDVIDEDLTECGYGAWQNRSLADLAKEDLWATVQTQPSAVTFPDGESMAAMQSRAVAAVRRHDADVEREFGPGAVWVAVSHGDIIKAVLAYALGMHLDLFQRLAVGPASTSIISYGKARPSVPIINSDAGDLSWLAPSHAAAAGGPQTGDATVGGGAGRAS
ncbi:putative phosphomutase (TIGR03848 family) [Pseudoclavibacter sp. JAI123]|uniref:MSMEG_4193 family putative phosphomutase n=1 Tax=Pseudoclavibacter sp. JAI123 TaxID=2723065 RepID=UPI0015CC83D3|nr:MSMEG_4193 family putative phosphomutase [Pseudoclavibacter sp. JAI123]NYF13965.1 putative phosphomutase (TIGR03848 family) [Pseudoclavibacter sp. JAI123]